MAESRDKRAAPKSTLATSRINDDLIIAGATKRGYATKYADKGEIGRRRPALGASPRVGNMP